MRKIIPAKHRRTIQVIGKSLVVLVLILFNLPFPIDKEVEAMEVKLDDVSYLEPRRIVMSGSYHFNLWKPNAFDGQITVSGYPITEQEMTGPLYFKRPHGCVLEYFVRVPSADGTTLERRDSFLGKMYAEAWMTNSILLVYTPIPTDGRNENTSAVEWNEESGYCIVPNVQTREEAIARLTKQGIIGHQ